MDNPCECPALTDVSPLRESELMLQKLDELLPIFNAFAEELEDFRKSVGNGAFSWKLKFPEEV